MHQYGDDSIRDLTRVAIVADGRRPRCRKAADLPPPNATAAGRGGVARVSGSGYVPRDFPPLPREGYSPAIVDPAMFLTKYLFFMHL